MTTRRVDDIDLKAILLGHIETEEARFDEGDKRMNRIEQELRPITKMYHAFLGAGMTMGLLLAVLVWVYLSDVKKMTFVTDTLVKQGLVIEKILTKHEELEKDYRREFERVEKMLDSKAPKHNWQPPG
jgi:hypothetical protein